MQFSCWLRIENLFFHVPFVYLRVALIFTWFRKFENFSLCSLFHRFPVHRNFIFLQFPSQELKLHFVLLYFLMRSHTTRSAAISANNGKPEKPQAGETQKNNSRMFSEAAKKILFNTRFRVNWKTPEAFNENFCLKVFFLDVMISHDNTSIFVLSTFTRWLSHRKRAKMIFKHAITDEFLASSHP